MVKINMDMLSVDKVYQLNVSKIINYAGKLIPEEIARQFELVPLGLRENRLLVSAAYPISRQSQNKIQKMTRYPLDIITSSLPDVRSAQYQVYHSEVYRPKPLDPELVLKKLGLINEIHMDKIKGKQGSEDTEKDLATLALENHFISEAQWGEVEGFCNFLPHLRPESALPQKGIDLLIPFNQTETNDVLPLWWIGNMLYRAITFSRNFKESSDSLETGYLNRVLVCAPEQFRHLRKKIYSRKSLPKKLVDEEMVGTILVKNKWLLAGDLAMAKEIKRQTGASLRSTITEKFGISAQHWLDAVGEILNIRVVHANNLPKDYINRIRSLLPLIPKYLVLKYGLFPISINNKCLVVVIPEIIPELLDLVETITGYPVEARLMDEDLIQSFFDSFRPDLERDTHLDNLGATPVTYSEFILGMGLLQKKQMAEINEKAHKTGENILDLIHKNGLLKENDLADLYSLIHGLPYLSLEYFQFDEELIRRFPADLMLKKQILPLLENDGDLWVAITDPGQCDVLWEIENLSHRRVWPVIGPKTLVLSTLHRFYQAQPQQPEVESAYRLVDRLIEAGLINRSDSFTILLEMADQHLAFDQAVLGLGNIDGDKLYECLAHILKKEHRKIGLKLYTEERFDPVGQPVTFQQWSEVIDVDAAHLIDHATAKRLCAIPIEEDHDRVLVAFADPIYENALKEISLLINRKVVVCLASREEIEAAIQRTLGQTNLGTSLLMAGMITLGQLNNALVLSRNTNVRLGKALVHRRFISDQQLFQFLAIQAHLPLFDLSEAQLDPEIARLLDVEMERRYGILPIAADDEKMILAVIDPLNKEAIASAEKESGLIVQPVLVTERDFDAAMEKLYQDDYLAQSISRLLERTPEDSAYNVFSRGQIIGLVIMAVIALLWLSWDYMSFLILINALATTFYLTFSLYKGYLMARALGNDLEVPVSDEEVAALQDRDLPIYTILVPVFNEASVLPNIIRSLSEIDYPLTRLDVKVLLEANDTETINAFYAANPPDFIQGIIVPDAQPKTKPKACNYGLIHARGEYLVIFDAEDLPDPDQLKRSVIAYQKVPAEVVCIQAKLNYYNRNQNLLTQWFTSEYSMWFDLLLPGLDAERAPIPLGGTSNHFKTFSLIEVGAWDPYNVTEDADLGIRLYKRGYRTRIIDSTTLEEANSQINNWIRQRSRWVKGYIQTWLVHMRHPIKLIQEIGMPAFISFQMLIGGTFFALLVNPIYWIMTSVWYVSHWNLIQLLYPGIIFYIGALCLYVGNFVFTYANIAGAVRHKYYDLVLSALFSPIYWGLMSIGAWKGFFQLLIKPHFWEKTRHGLTKQPKTGTDQKK